MFFKSLFAVALLIALPIAAQDEDTAISADRPGFGDSATTMGKGEFQYEFGMSFTAFDNPALLVENNSVEQSNWGEAWLRYGLKDNLELRIGLGSFVNQSNPNDSGFDSASLSLKYQMTDDSDPAVVSFFGGATMTTGVVFSDTETELFGGVAIETEFGKMPGSLYLAYHEGEDQLSVSAYTGGDLTGNWDWNAGLAGFINHGDVTTYELVEYQFGSRFEEFGEIGAENEFLLDLNFMYPLSKKTQFDVYIGAGLTDDSPDYFWGMGYAAKW